MKTFEVRRMTGEFGTFRWAIWNRLTNEEAVKTLTLVSRRVALKKAREMNSYWLKKPTPEEIKAHAAGLN